MITVDVKTATQFKHLFWENPAFVRFIRTWGEAGTVETKTSTTPKLSNRGVHCMFVGYANNHDGDCNRMLNAETLHVLTTRDVIWMKRLYFVPAHVTQSPAVELIENNNNNTIKSGESVSKVIFNGHDGLSKSSIPTGSISDKKLSVARGNLSNYLMKIIVFSQLYRSKSATLEIAYDAENRFLVMYYLFPL